MSVKLAHSTDTVSARTARMAMMVNVPDGGFSFNARTGELVTDGFAVAVYPHAERKIGDRVQRADVVAYAYEHAALLITGENVFGAWRDPSDGVAYFDVSRVVATREEAESLARAHGQLAYFDFAAGTSVPV